MRDSATFRRTAAAVGLVTTTALMFVSVVLAPEFPGDFESLLAEIEAGGASARLSALAFTAAQLPLVAALLGIGHLLRAETPVLSNLGTSLGVVGAFGHAVYGGVTLVQLSMADDVANHPVHAAVLRDVESGPAVAFMAMGLLGTVLGFLLLSIGLWRAHVAPRWVGPVLWAFLVVEFAGSAVTEWSAHLAVLLYAVALLGLAVTVVRTSAAEWSLATAAPARTPADV